MERVDVVVVGAGVMGSATARALGRRGVETLVLEQFRVGHARGSSHGPTRIFRLSYPHVDYVRLAQQALAVWSALQEEAGEELLVTTGGLDAGEQAADCAEALSACGAPVEWLGSAEAEERFPGFAFDGVDRVLFQPNAGVCYADRTVAAQVRLARASGVDVREDTEVVELRPGEDGVRIRTDAGEIEARVAVLTAGPWAARLLPDVIGAPAAPALAPTLQVVGYFEPVEPALRDRMPTFVDWTGPGIAGYAVPVAGIAPGVKVGDHGTGTPVDPAAGPFDVDGARLSALAEFVKRRLPGADPEPVAAEACLYTMTPDEDFVLDRIGNVVVGAGFSGHGFKFAPLIGELLADLALGERTDLPDRFSAARGALRSQA